MIHIKAEDLRGLLNERATLYKNLTLTQKRCSELVLELRQARTVINYYQETLGREETKNTCEEGGNCPDPMEGRGVY